MQAGEVNAVTDLRPSRAAGVMASVTDRVLEDMQDSATHELRWSAYTRPSTGLVYMQARYYDPEIGRFTQHDPVPYGMEVLWGQNNRWAYCANDPVNASDPSGLFPWVAVLAVVGVILFGWGMSVGLSASRQARQYPNLAGLITAAGSTLLSPLLKTALAEELSLFSLGEALSVGPIPVLALLVACFALGLFVGVFIGYLWDEIHECFLAATAIEDSPRRPERPRGWLPLGGTMPHTV